MNFVLNSNTVMAVIMFVTLLGGGWTYVENKIASVQDSVPRVHKPYNDEAIMERLDKLEAVNVQKELAVIQQQLSDLPKPYDPAKIEQTINEIQVIIATIQTKLEAVENREHQPN